MFFYQILLESTELLENVCGFNMMDVQHFTLELQEQYWISILPDVESDDREVWSDQLVL